MNRQPIRFRWLELASAVLLIVVLAISLAPLNSDFIRRKLVDWVDETTSYHMEIDGAFEPRLALTPGFHATSVRFQEKNLTGSYTVRRLTLNISLISLLVGKPLVKSLIIDGVEPAAMAGGSLDLPPPKASLPSSVSETLPEIEKLELKDVLFKVDEQTTLFIGNWNFEREKDGNKMHLRGDGRIAERDYRISGEIGGLSALGTSETPYPLTIAVEHQATHLSLDGSILDPLNASGIDLAIDVKAPDLSATLSAQGIQIPRVGALHGRAQLIGSLERPSLRDLYMEISDGQTSLLATSESITNLRAAESDLVRLKASTKQPEVLAWLLPDYLSDIQHMEADGRLAFAPSGLRFEAFKINLSGSKGMALDLNGDGTVEDFRAEQPFSNLDLVATLRSQDTALLRRLLDGLPELGPVQGKLHITALSDTALSIDDIDVVAGMGEETTLAVTGRVARVPVSSSAPNEGIDLGFNLSTAESGRLTGPLDAQLPELGPLHMTGRLRGSSDRPSLENIALRAGTMEKLSLKASGNVQLGALHTGVVLDTDLKIDFSSQDTASAAALIGLDLPELGPMSGRFAVNGSPRELRAREIHIEAGQPDGVWLSAAGELSQIQLTPEFTARNFRLKLTAQADTTENLSSLLGFDLPDLGPFHGQALLRGHPGHLGMEQAVIRVGRDKAPILLAEGKVSDIHKWDGVDWNIRMDIDSHETLRSLLAGLPSGALRDQSRKSPLTGGDRSREEPASHEGWPIGMPIELRGRFTGGLKSRRFTGTLALGRTEMTANIAGSLEGIRPKFEGKIEAGTLYLADFGLFEKELITPAQTIEQGIEHTRNPRGARDRLFDTRPLPLDWLANFDLDVEVLANDVIGTRAKLKSFVIPVTITDGGTLRIASATFLYEEGEFLFDLEIERNTTPPSFELRINGDDISVGQSLTHVGTRAALDGSLNVSVDLASQGRSPAELAANLEGTIELGMEEITFPHEIVDLLAVDFFGWTLSSTFGKGRAAKLDCGIIMLKANDGKLVSEVLFFDGSNLALLGEGSLDLGRETIDLSLYPKKKKRFWSKVNPVTITGALTAPSVTTIATGTAAARYGILAAAPEIFVPLTALGRLGELFTRDASRGANSACLQYTQRAELQRERSQ